MAYLLGRCRDKSRCTWSMYICYFFFYKIPPWSFHGKFTCFRVGSGVAISLNVYPVASVLLECPLGWSQFRPGPSRWTSDVQMILWSVPPPPPLRRFSATWPVEHWECLLKMGLPVFVPSSCRGSTQGHLQLENGWSLTRLWRMFHFQLITSTNLDVNDG